MEGWIKLHRKLSAWEWYTDVNTCHLFIHLLIHANHEPAQWRGINIGKGQLITGRDSLAMQTGLSSKSVRTSLEKLKGTNEVAIESTNQFSIITIVKWDDYQIMGQQMGQQRASQTASEGPADRPAKGQPNGHKQEDKNEKNNKKESICLPENIKTTCLFELESSGEPEHAKLSENHFSEFWMLFPKQRAGSKTSAEKAYQKALDREKEEVILAAVKKYSGSEEVAKGFAKGAAAWLNDDRWTHDYSARMPAKPDNRIGTPTKSRVTVL